MRKSPEIRTRGHHRLYGLLPVPRRDPWWCHFLGDYSTTEGVICQSSQSTLQGILIKGVIQMTLLKRWQFDLPMHPGDLLGE
jgi:hypothetical protein